MRVSDYDFELPEHLIAQKPLLDRKSSKLLVLNEDGSIEDKVFSDITTMLTNKDILVLNNTRVIPARLIGKKETTGGKIEILLVKEVENDIWETLVKPAKRIKVGDRVIFGNDDIIAECLEIKEQGMRVFKMIYEGMYLEVLEKLGTMPLPPYIHEKLLDQERYQTVYSKVPGSVAAPTAGLHFTKEILDKLKESGVEILFVTLDVSLGTFRPVSVDLVEDHHMHKEKYTIDMQTATALNNAKSEGKRIVAVGTTSIRTLESNFNKFGKFKEDTDETDIFIYPGYEFKAVDSLITNFHLPKSTLMMLISAFLSKDKIFKAYTHAIDKEYRFFSFGDSMFINKDSK